MTAHYLDPYSPNDSATVLHQDKFDESTLRARMLDDIAKKMGGLVAKSTVSLIVGVAASATSGGLFGQEKVVSATIGAATSLIWFGLSRYQRSPEVKGLFNILDASISNELKRTLKNTSDLSATVAEKSATAMASWNALGLYKAAYPYRLNTAMPLVKMHLSPMNLVEFFRETLAMLRHKKSVEHFENYFSQRTQFEVNLAHLAALMGESGDYADLKVSFDHYSVRAFMKKSASILPFFAKNNIRLESMMSALREAIGPDASLVFGKESLDINKVDLLMRPLLCESAVFAKRQAEIDNLSTMLLYMAVDIEKEHYGLAAQSQWSPAELLRVAEELQQLIKTKQDEHLQRNISPKEPDRKFKYQGMLSACDLFIQRYQQLPRPALPKPRSESDLLLSLGDMMFRDPSDRPYTITVSQDDRGAQHTLIQPKTIYDAYATGMSDAIKDALRKSVYVNDFFENRPQAVNAIASRIMTKVFLIAHLNEKNPAEQQYANHLCGDTVPEHEIKSALQAIVAPEQHSAGEHCRSVSTLWRGQKAIYGI